jgi:hypothetical protein
MSEISFQDIHLSLLHAVQNIILQGAGYTGSASGVALEVDSNFSGSLPTDRQILTVNPSGVVDSSYVSFKDGGRILGADEFFFDYERNTFILAAEPSGALTADYSFHQELLMEAFPDSDALTDDKLPVVSVEPVDQTSKPFDLTSTVTITKQVFVVDVFAGDLGTASRIGDLVQQWLYKNRMPVFRLADNPLFDKDMAIKNGMVMDSVKEYDLSYRTDTSLSWPAPGASRVDRHRAAVLVKLHPLR